VKLSVHASGTGRQQARSVAASDIRLLRCRGEMNAACLYGKHSFFSFFARPARQKWYDDVAFARLRFREREKIQKRLRGSEDEDLNDEERLVKSSRGDAGASSQSQSSEQPSTVSFEYSCMRFKIL
jgi:hypothetical protein